MLASHLAATAAASSENGDKIFKRQFIKSKSTGQDHQNEDLILIELQGSLNLTSSTASKNTPVSNNNHSEDLLDNSRIRIGEIDLQNESLKVLCTYK